ncbi:MAG: hypothetical protein IJ571_08930 [Ruminococcus sp.]|nr:hypothetical protein [Ruminococcus sp.]
MDKLRFLELCEQTAETDPVRDSIGTLGEKTLHAVLKAYFEPNSGNREIKLGRYVADIAGENGIIEIQTRHLYRLRSKLEAFLEFCDVTVVYPLCAEKYVRWLDMDTGELSPRRRSPKRAKPHDIFSELVNIKYVLDNPRFTFCAVLIEAEDIRYLNGRSKDKKKGSSRCDRVPLSLIDELWLRSPDDYRQFLPSSLPEPFTVLQYAKACGISSDLARSELNVLCYLGHTEVTQKQGSKNLYRILPSKG